MFFKQPVLKRMLKAAYKNEGITVGHTKESEKGIPEGYYVFSNRWGIWIMAERMPKEVKAALIELCGDLPEAGEAFRARKDRANQYEIEQKEAYDLPEGFMKCEYRFRVTKLLGQQGDKTIRFLQEERTQRVAAVNETIIDLINPEAVDSDHGEYEPFGPVAASPEARFMYWGNNTCYLIAGIRSTDDEEEAELWKFLEGTEII